MCKFRMGLRLLFVRVVITGYTLSQYFVFVFFTVSIKDATTEYCYVPY